MNAWCRVRPSFFVRLDSPTLYDTRFEQVDALFNHIDFHKASMSGFGVENRIQLFSMKSVPATK